MRILGPPAAMLAWLGRQGTRAVAASIVLGILLPPLGALLRPWFAETVMALLVLTFLRVEPEALRAQWTKPRTIVLAAVWSMVAIPALMGFGLLALDLRHTAPALFLALLMNAVAPPTFSSPALAALIGLNAAASLALLLACTAASPFAAPALLGAFTGNGVTVSPLSLGLRLVLMLAGAACIALAIRGIAGRDWVARQAERINGLSVVMLFLFALALMSNVLGNALANPLLVVMLLALAFAVTLALSALTALAFMPFDADRGLAIAHAAGSRNMGLMLAAAAGLVPELVWLYVALAQLPIYLLPLFFKPLAKRLAPRQDGATP
jgi:predicted Na+-dependent transporter